LQCAQSEWWILSTDKRWHFKFTTDSQRSADLPRRVLRANWRELFFGEAGRIMPQAERDGAEQYF
jgi:hypothetical protein